MEHGIVDRYSEQKGFGYILQEDGQEILVERSSLNMPGYKTLIPGDRVIFEVKKSIRGRVAKNVEKEKYS